MYEIQTFRSQVIDLHIMSDTVSPKPEHIIKLQIIVICFQYFIEIHVEHNGKPNEQHPVKGNNNR